MKINAGQASSTLIPEYIGSDFDKVITVADNIDYVKDVADGIEGLLVTGYIGDTPPTQPKVGATWYCTLDGRTYTWYEDDDSSQWVESSPQSYLEPAEGGNVDPSIVDAVNNNTNNIFVLWKRSVAEAGLTPVGGSFENGGTLTTTNDVLLHKASGIAYSWGGTLPITVAPNSTPTPLGSGWWVDRSDVTLRSKLAASGGANLVNSEYRKTFYLADAKWGLDPSVTSDNTAALALIMQNCPDNTVLDFCGMELRVFANVTGIASSGATPATSKALPFAQCPAMNGKKNITLKNGVVYAANAGKSVVKMYFPSTVSFINCQGIHFENFTAEGKGESWGDADASVTLTKAQRLLFNAENGGSAVYFGRCTGITGSLTTRLCGSVAPMYFSSCDEINLDSPFSNPASLGYAAFAADAWVGSLADVGKTKFHCFINNPIAHKETLYRREDGTTPVGSSTYCGKGGCLTEDTGVVMQTIGGRIANMYANGSSKKLGYAFGAASGGLTTSVGAVVRDCQEVEYITWSTSDPAIITVDDVDAETGLTGVLVDDKSFGTGFARLTGRIKVNNTRGWDGETNELNKTSIVACLKPASLMRVELGLTVDRASSIYSLINNETNACYGGVKFLYGDYVSDGYIMRSQGWGASGSGSRDGLVDCGSTFHDISTTTDELIQYKNLSDLGVYTYIHHDMSRSKISAATTRAVDGYTISGTNLDEFIQFGKPSFGAYVTTPNRVAWTSTLLTCASVDGLLGANTLVSFYIKGNHGLKTDARIINGANFHRVLGPNAGFTAGTTKDGVKRQYVLEGDVRSSYAANSTYMLLGS